MRSCCQCVMVVTNLLLYNFTTHLIFCSINFTALQIKKQTWSLSSWSWLDILTQSRNVNRKKPFQFIMCWLLAHSDLVFTSTLRGDRIPSPPSLAFQTWDHSRPENTHTYFEVSPLHLMFGSSINETTSQYFTSFDKIQLITDCYHWYAAKFLIGLEHKLHNLIGCKT